MSTPSRRWRWRMLAKIDSVLGYCDRRQRQKRPPVSDSDARCAAIDAARKGQGLCDGRSTCAKELEAAGLEVMTTKSGDDRAVRKLA